MGATMRTFLILPLSAALLGGCLTSQENPNYELSTRYQGDLEARHQYADAAPVAPVVVSYESVPAQPIAVQTSTVMATATPVAPTDSVYGTRDVSGTPGFMAMQSERQSVSIEAAAPMMSEAEIVSTAPLGAAGTPIAYDYSRNLVSVDAVTTGQQLPETVRVMQGTDQSLLQGQGQNYTVQQGDTVYSLSRKTCVGVNVIQSMNGLNTDYAIKIGQSITLPSSVC